jgi:hypothetical protein
MPNPIQNWTEDDVLALPAGENDSFERKGSRLLDLTIQGVREDDVLNELGKQLSAFANTGGGQIIYGVADNGTVDSGGVALCTKGRQSTKDWLEDVIPKLTELEIVGFNVYPIEPKSGGSSAIASGKALFVIDVPDSDRAPHQSTRDRKYYVRLGGKSQPAPHRLIEDIRNRQKYPLLQTSEIKLEINDLPVTLQGPLMRRPIIDGDAPILFDIRLENIGHMMARNSCIRLAASMPIRWSSWDTNTVRLREQGFWELRDPIYPGMTLHIHIVGVVPVCYGIVSAKAPFGGPWLVNRRYLADVHLSWSIFADDAPAKHGSATMDELGFEEAARVAVHRHPQGGLIRQMYPTMP